MKNTKLTEFILMNEEFYNLLSDHNKTMISDLDEYFDLGLWQEVAKNLEVSDVYLLIGKKSNIFFLYKVPYNLNKDGIELYISKGKVVLLENLEKLWKMYYK